MSPYLQVEGDRSRRVPVALTFLALKCATIRNLTNGVWAKTLWFDPAKKKAGTAPGC